MKFLAFNTKADRIVSTLWLCGIATVFLNLALHSKRWSSILLLVSLVLYTPMVGLSFIRLMRSRRELKRLELELRVKEILIETFAPEAWKQIQRDRELARMFAAKPGKAEK